MLILRSNPNKTVALSVFFLPIVSLSGIFEFQPDAEGKLETVKLSLNGLHNPDHLTQWFLTSFPNVQLLDFSATTAIPSTIEICLKIKANKVSSVSSF